MNRPFTKIESQMANKHFETYKKVLYLQAKTMIYYFTLFRLTKIYKSDNITWQGC